MNKKLIFSLILGMVLISLFFVNVSAANVCCEKTLEGAWCQNTNEANCDESINPFTNDPFRVAPTSCDSTSYCQSGCCYDSDKGTCSRNTPEIICNKDGGVWDANEDCDVPQCELGCCLIGNQAAFVPKQRCKRLASLYGLDIDFRTDVSNEIQCILSTTSEKEGACVFEEEFETTCRFLTKNECLNSGNSNISFHEGFLCTAEELNTNCARTENTVCVDGRDEVFFEDSCGNVANIYNSAKVNEPSYWRKVVSKNDSCGYGNSNADSTSCGNCDYYSGSTCKEYERGVDRSRPIYGDNVCRNLDCEEEGKRHGETWCANSLGIKNNLPGSRHFRMVCYNGEVSVEPCADYRQEICIESDIDGFSTSACRANRWHDCTAQTKKRDCENKDRRDCVWNSGATIECGPEFAPGFNFWSTDEGGEAEDVCSGATVTCTITCEEGLSGDAECDSEPSGCGDEDGLDPAWEARQNQVCGSLGDCGIKVNWVGRPGFNSDDE
jgi:hypothetical protein